jgi:hypothetical protein
VKKARKNGVILETRLTSAGTRDYFYRTYLLEVERGNMEPVIAFNTQQALKSRPLIARGRRLESAQK